jgi:hypothetical protein
MEKIRIGGWKKFGSGIRYKHPGYATLSGSPHSPQYPLIPVAVIVKVSLLVTNGANNFLC